MTFEQWWETTGQHIPSGELWRMAWREAQRPEVAAHDVQRLLPSGWMAVPVNPTIAMHNAAATGELYEAPVVKMDDDGYLRVIHACPDWSSVWRKMIAAAPSILSFRCAGAGDECLLCRKWCGEEECLASAVSPPRRSAEDSSL